MIQISVSPTFLLFCILFTLDQDTTNTVWLHFHFNYNLCCDTVAGWGLLQCVLVRGRPAVRSYHLLHRREQGHLYSRFYRLWQRGGAEP